MGTLSGSGVDIADIDHPLRGWVENGIRYIGGAGNDTLEGTNYDDKFYGGDDDDILIGLGGDDYLEGGNGNDRLFGEDGYDTYRIDSGDTLQDSDGKGDVWLSGQQLHGGEKEEDEDIWKDDLGNAYQMSGNTLLIQGSGGGVTIKQFSNHTLGIHLVDNYFLDENIRSPIALDLNGDGLATTTLQGGAYFDHGNDGFAEQTAWLNREDGLLALDRDGNGSIDNGLELFDSRTLLSNGQYADNGYEALAEFDDNGDGQIDAQDSAYTTIMIWQDRNGDGESGSEELLTMAVAQVQSIATAYTETFQDDNGNPILVS